MPKSLRSLVLGLAIITIAACAPVPVKLANIKPISPNNIRLLEQPPYAFTSKVDRISITNKTVSMPAAGEKNSYGSIVSPALADAYQHYLTGKGNAALTSIRQAERSAKTVSMQWQLSMLRAQTLIMMGRAADAISELDTTARLERAYTGHELNSLALKGEAKVWLGDYQSAKHDFSRIILAIGNWRLPTSYGAPPGNLGELVALTTAQLRSYVGMAGIHSLQGNHVKALAWARQAEDRLNDVHYVADHSLYGPHLPTHADSYYGRAINLGFLAASELATGNEKAGMQSFKIANAYFDAIGYENGKATLSAFKAQAWLHRGDNTRALQAADVALQLSAKGQLHDLTWRIETLRGVALFNDKRFDEAEIALRHAQHATNAVLGSLSSDRAKRRFGVGKDDISYYLSMINRRNENLNSLFSDLELSRARAFVDMLADNALPKGRSEKLVSQIRKLDKQIRTNRASLMAIKADSSLAPLVENNLRKRKQLLVQLRVKDKELADTLEVEEYDLGTIREYLYPGETLAYALPARNNDIVALLVVNRKQASIYKTALTASNLSTRLGLFASAVAGRDAELQKDLATSLAKAISIEKWQGDSSTYFVASGASHYIPWGAFATDSPVIILPTGSWLTREKQYQRYQIKAVVVGDPNFHNELPQLPGAREEAAHIARQYQVSAITGNNATESNLRNSINKGVNTLHIASHALFNHEKPLLSSIVLTGNSSAKYLTANQLFQDPLPASLVVLSACETGMGKVVAGDDLIGLTRGFYLGGSRAILSSLWPVEDQGTRLYMEVFHKAASKGDLGKAWISARNAVRKAGYPPSVYAAFTLGGSRRLN